MRGNSSTNLVLQIYLSKLRHYIFSEKTESPYFTNLERGPEESQFEFEIPTRNRFSREI